MKNLQKRLKRSEWLINNGYTGEFEDKDKMTILF